MGCDIHEYVEIKVNGVWKSLYKPVIEFDSRFNNKAQHARITKAVLNNLTLSKQDYEVFRDYSYINFERGEPDIRIEFDRDYGLSSALNGVRSREIVHNQNHAALKC